MTASHTELVLHVDDRVGDVSAILSMPEDPIGIYVFGHGAGAGMRHAFMQGMSERFFARGLATLRYQFPYTEAGKKRPDPKPRLLDTVAAAIAAAREHAPGLPLFAGGKSMGGRKSSMLVAEREVPVRGLVFLGFPLHPAKKPAIDRAEHLARVQAPMLFVSGTRDDLADFALLSNVLRDLGARAELHVVEGGDHSLSVRRSSGTTTAAVLEIAAEAVAHFVRRHA
jgi:predicted alpha/beta-hydrolase family hydrolase